MLTRPSSGSSWSRARLLRPVKRWRIIVRAIVGELPTPSKADSMAVRRDDGSWLLDGMLSVSELRELLSLPSTADGDLEEFQTLGGFVMGRIGHVPQAGERFEWSGLRFEVVDMDDRRVDKVLVTRTADGVDA